MGERPQILIVDDDESICRWLNAVLRAEGYQCRIANSWEEAEPLLEAGTFHHALLDIYLGDRNGLEFVGGEVAVQICFPRSSVPRYVLNTFTVGPA